MLDFPLARTLAVSAALAAAFAAPALAESTSYDATLTDIAATFGSVPTFIKAVPKAALPGAWLEEKMLELSNSTAPPPKVKALISFAVAAQIPCQYRIWSDTMAARQAGASDEEIGEAVAMAALTRHWSTLFNGLQVDFDAFKKDMGGDTASR